MAVKLEKKQLLQMGTAVSFAGVILWFDLRPYGALFTLLILFWVSKQCYPNYEISVKSDAGVRFHTAFNKFLELRETKPTLFCIIACSICGIFAILGSIISGSTLLIVLCGLALLLCNKLNFTLVKIENDDDQRTKAPTPQDTEIDEFMPEANETNMFVLKSASEEALVNPNADDEESSISDDIKYILPDSIPEIDENLDSSDSEDLITPAMPHSIEFRSGYFKRDTSSSDDDSLTSGLSFHDYEQQQQQQHATPQKTKKQPAVLQQTVTAQTRLQNQLLTGMVTEFVRKGVENLLSGAAVAGTTNKPTPPGQQRQTAVARQHSSGDSSDSDFEILNSDELNNLT